MTRTPAASPHRRDRSLSGDDNISLYSDSAGTVTSRFSLAPTQITACTTALPDNHEGPHGAENRILYCEFDQFFECRARFRADQFDQWVDHIVSGHLLHRYPKTTWCWFCDDSDEFSTDSNDMGERAKCFRRRMAHIARHLEDGNRMEEMRPDHPFMNHLVSEKLISEEFRDHARTYHEAPQPRGEFLSPITPIQRDPERVTVIASSRQGRHRRERQQTYHN